ncbi:hypothetical protein ACVWZZ_005931 [Bradyrhizobium sp. LM6.10]
MHSKRVAAISECATAYWFMRIADAAEKRDWCGYEPLDPADLAVNPDGSDGTNTGHHLAFRQVTAAHDALVAVRSLQIGMLARQSATSASTAWPNKYAPHLPKISVS